MLTEVQLTKKIEEQKGEMIPVNKVSRQDNNFRSIRDQSEPDEVRKP